MKLKLGWVAGCILLMLNTASAQQKQQTHIAELFTRIAAAKSDTAKATLYNLLGTAHYDTRKTNKHALDSALYWQRMAEATGAVDTSCNGYKGGVVSQAILHLIRNEHTLAHKKISLLPGTYLTFIYAKVANLHAESYNNKPSNSDSVITYSHKVLHYARLYKQLNYEIWGLNALSVFYHMTDRIDVGKQYVESLDSIYRTQHNLEKRALLWHNIAEKIPHKPENFAEKTSCLLQAKSLLEQTKEHEKLAHVHIYLADIYTDEGRLDLAMNAAKTAEQILRTNGFNTTFKVSPRFYDIYRMQGDFEKALEHMLEGIKEVQKNKGRNIEHAYTRLGITYYELADYENAIRAFEMGIKVSRDSGKIVPGVLVKWHCKTLLANNQKKEALTYTESMEKEFSSRYGADDKMNLYEAYGDCYDALGQFEKAESFYNRMIDPASGLAPAWVMAPKLALGKFYYRNKRFDKTKAFFDEVMQNPNVVPANVQADISYMLYKTDSANGNYLSAMNHLNRYKLISDTIFNAKKTRLIAEITTRYEVEKKNNDLLLKDQAILRREKEIELLTKQGLLQKLENEKRLRDILVKESRIELLKNEAELQKALAASREKSLILNDKTIRLNAQDIQLLKRKSELQDAALKQSNFTKRITIGGLVLLFIILALLYNQYRIKQKSSRKISEQNILLEKLLEEKDWLVKEVHHRVKNHLQIMQSLLESQAAYLSDEALAAVQVSQQRVQAMSLIHQKLYQSGNNDEIDMKVYVCELTECLKESLSDQKKIKVNLQVEPLTLDLAQAVPLGLIINEGITNSFKHAFTNQDSGELTVVLKSLDDHTYRLELKDTGKGLPPGFNINTHGSLGLKLMKGLSEQIHGTLSIENREGTNVAVEFKVAKNHASYLKAI
ncbi:histidine kinase dimerization/phosphoacceptor domain -containing protein [Parasegetibacter sp. NRK P23]|uniref:tetratricopeptide repeat-containing sensor histidine kinase n=1 Tax=Parasegetibacter sp. NRK P23 TaxID=2942999 RepID=UPI002043C580|nr:histidine kinase dimerization/phosphoacceptor domain -containing protein [Parasegetibacter sp. NRK P23]MCM5527453.1 ATP-binding protein [Parasegetibacter sp. NRK P23]